MRAAVGRHQPDDHVEAGGLAGAVRAEQADDLAAGDRPATRRARRCGTCSASRGARPKAAPGRPARRSTVALGPAADPSRQARCARCVAHRAQWCARAAQPLACIRAAADAGVSAAARNFIGGLQRRRRRRRLRRFTGLGRRVASSVLRRVRPCPGRAGNPPGWITARTRRRRARVAPGPGRCCSALGLEELGARVVGDVVAAHLVLAALQERALEELEKSFLPSYSMRCASPSTYSSTPSRFWRKRGRLADAPSPTSSCRCPA